MRDTKRKGFTIMIVPYSGEKPCTFSISPFVLKVLAVTMVLVAAASIFGLSAFQEHRARSIQYEEVLAQNRSLEERVLFFSEATNQLQTQVAKMQHLDVTIRDMLDLEASSAIAAPVVDVLTVDDPLTQAQTVNSQPVDFSLMSDKTELLATSPNSDDGTLEDRTLEDRTLEDRTLEDRTLLTGRGGLDRTILNTTLNISSLNDFVPQQEKSLSDLEGAVEEHNARLAATPSIRPTNGIITSPYGYRRSPFGYGYDFHNGIDLGGSIGQPVYATADGVVKNTSYSSGYGRMILINHGFGFTTVYAHLSRYNVSSGQKVKRGDTIGFVGNTGRSTGPHLHYEVRVNNSTRNPVPYLKSQE